MRISSIRTKSGEVIDVSQVTTLCVVGGNNVGKSQFLREVQNLIISPNPLPGMLVESVEFGFDFPDGGLENWLALHAKETLDDRLGRIWRVGSGSGYRAEVIKEWLGAPRPYIEPIADWFIQALDSGLRSAIATGGLGISGMGTGAPSALRALWLDGDLESEFSDLSQKVFGFPLTLDRVTGKGDLRVGRPDVESPPLQHPTREYVDAVERLPPLSSQGDGVKNYLGMLLHVMTGDESITVIDEPEAFLHPAQARSLGRRLGQSALIGRRQLLTATHDRDFVLGLLESGGEVMFVRIGREGDRNSFAVLSPGRVSAVWDKPILRYSNVLQGLFHRSVVVCEGDADCRWYSAVLDEMGSRAAFAHDEVLFVSGGGVDQVPNVLAALTSMEVDAFAVVDFDVIYDPPFLKRLAESRGIPSDRLLKLSRAISAQLVGSAARNRAKQTGVRGLPAGDCASMAKELVGILRGYRVLVVEVGQLESFDNKIPGHGPSWVAEALSQSLHRSCREAQAVLSPVVAEVWPAVDGAQFD